MQPFSPSGKRPYDHVLRGNVIQDNRVGAELLNVDNTTLENNEMSGNVEADVVERAWLSAGEAIAGPAIITEYSSTIVLPPKWCCAVDPFGHLLLARKEAEQ